MARDNEREYEVIIPNNELKTAGEPVDNVVPPRTPRTEPTPESSLELLNPQVIIPMKKDQKCLLHKQDLPL